MTALTDLLACPRCDKAPLATGDNGIRCDACKIDFPSIDGIPWMFAEPQASLGEWRNRLQMALTRCAHEVAGLDEELKDGGLRDLTRQRLSRYRNAVDTHRRSLAQLLAPLDVESQTASYESYLALRTRLPADQGLNTYYANAHRDWAWGDEENAASLAQIESVLADDTALGRVLVLGAGAGRLAWDVHMELDGSSTVALDFNPLLMLILKRMAAGEILELHEFPIAPKTGEDDAVLRQLAAPAATREGFDLVLGDALRPPFAPGSFDTVITPWLIDIISEDLPTFAARINALLADSGRWINFGSLAFDSPARAGRYGPDEVAAIVSEAGFAEPRVNEATIPYMCSPASRHGRRETVFTFAARKQQTVKAPARHKALPDWLVTGNAPVPLTQAFRTQAMTTQIYAFMMSLIDGKRSLDDMATILEKQKLMSRAEALPALRNFFTRMFDDAQKPPR